MLVVLDDAWSLEVALACQVGGPQCAYVLTTRLPQVAQSFALSESYPVEPLEEEAGLDLLRELAPWAVEQAPEPVRALVHEVGGLPLALSLLGYTLRQQTHNRQPRRLQTALQRLQNGLARLQLAQPPMPGDPIAQGGDGVAGERRSLAVVISSSAEYLSVQARQAWAALSILPARPQSFGEEAALAVSEMEVETLDELSDAGVLEAMGPGRYMLHRVLADYGHAQLSESEQEAARQRLITYSLSYAEEHQEHYEALEEEASVLTVGLEACVQADASAELLRLTLALARFWRTRGNYSQSDEWLPLAARSAYRLGWPREEVHVRLVQGEIAVQRGDYEQGLQYYEQGLALARQVGEADLVCASLRGVGWVASRRGKYERAEQILREGLALARQQSLVQQQAGLLRDLGSVVDHQGKIDEERVYLQEGLQLAQQIGDHELTCNLFNSLGVLNYTLGHIAEAVQCYQDGLVLARQRGYHYLEGILLANLGGITCVQGDYVQSERYLQEALSRARQLGAPEYICVALIVLGEVALARGEYRQAEDYLQEGLSLARQLGAPRFVCAALIVLGKVALARGEYRQAEGYLQEGLSLARQLGAAEYICAAFIDLGEAAFAQGNYEPAVYMLREGWHLACHVGLPMYIGQAAIGLGEVALAQKDIVQAEQWLQKGQQLARQLQLRPLLCRILYQWGILTLQRGQLEEATASFEEILETASEDARLVRAQAQYGLAQVAAIQGQIMQARQHATQALSTLEAIRHRETIQVRSWLEGLEQDIEMS
jgi:tetratricopeptide (TPR) repeat protein